jgi:hypothetical protein
MWPLNFIKRVEEKRIEVEDKWLRVLILRIKALIFLCKDKKKKVICQLIFRTN